MKRSIIFLLLITITKSFAFVECGPRQVEDFFKKRLRSAFEDQHPQFHVKDVKVFMGELLYSRTGANHRFVLSVNLVSKEDGEEYYYGYGPGPIGVNSLQTLLKVPSFQLVKIKNDWYCEVKLAKKFPDLNWPIIRVRDNEERRILTLKIFKEEESGYYNGPEFKVKIEKGSPELEAKKCDEETAKKVFQKGLKEFGLDFPKFYHQGLKYLESKITQIVKAPTALTYVQGIRGGGRRTPVTTETLNIDYKIYFEDIQSGEHKVLSSKSFIYPTNKSGVCMFKKADHARFGLEGGGFIFGDVFNSEYNRDFASKYIHYYYSLVKE